MVLGHHDVAGVAAPSVHLHGEPSLPVAQVEPRDQASGRVVHLDLRYESRQHREQQDSGQGLARRLGALVGEAEGADQTGHPQGPRATREFRGIDQATVEGVVEQADQRTLVEQAGAVDDGARPRGQPQSRGPTTTSLSSTPAGHRSDVLVIDVGRRRGRT